MTSGEPSEIKRSAYDACDPQYLRQLREASGMDVVVLARIACLSVAQVRQLETEGGGNLFYSDAIKHQAYKRLLMILGAEPPSVDVPAELLDAHKVAHAHLATLDQIVAMSEQPPMNHTMSDTFQAWGQSLLLHRQTIASLVLLLLASVLFVLYGPHFSNNAAPPVEHVVAPAPVVNLPASSPEVVAVAAPTASLPTLPAVVTTTPTSAIGTSNVCEVSHETMPQVTPFVAHKEGRYIYVVSSAQTELCVVDGNQQATLLQFKTGENRSVYGTSPWQVSAADLSKIQIYFQGGRVTLPEGAKRVKLIEVPVTR